MRRSSGADSGLAGGQASARGVGLLVAAAGLVETAFLAVAQLSTSSPLSLIVELTACGGYGGSILWVLLRRWP